MGSIILEINSGGKIKFFESGERYVSILGGGRGALFLCPCLPLTCVILNILFAKATTEVLIWCQHFSSGFV